jgi:hypothetical protein
MQTIKDSFYIALRDRLAALDPARVVTVLGVTRPAVIVIENELADSTPLLSEAFYLSWGECSAAAGTERLDSPLLQLACEITYWTQGSDALSNQDRGRTLAQLDTELRTIAAPQSTALKDHSQSPVADLGANIFWTRPTLNAITQDGNKLTRTAALHVFAFAEVAQ